MAAAQRLRQGTPSRRVMAALLERLPDDTSLVSFVEVLVAAHQAVSAGDYRTVMPRLRTPVLRSAGVVIVPGNELGLLAQQHQANRQLRLIEG